MRLTHFEKAVLSLCDHLDQGIVSKAEFEKQLASLVLNWYRELPR